MFKLFLLLLHFILHVSSCPTGWQASSVIDGKCYLFVTQRETWYDAESYCRNAAADGHLTSINSAFENIDIFGLGKRQCAQYWIGLNDNRHFGTFTWTDGRPLQYTNWDTDQPNINEINRCVALNGQSNGKWRAEYCGVTNCFFCESYQFPITTTPSTPMTDCYDWLHIGGARNDGIYQIRIPGLTDSLNVWCDMTTDGGGWTVFQRRINGDLSFYDKTWNQYKNGFNNGLDKNLWLGNDAIHLLSTKDKNVTLRIDIWGDRAPNSQYARGYLWQKQSSFSFGNETNYYTFHASTKVEGNASISGSEYDGINYNIGHPFSTIDNNHDNVDGGCTKPPKDLGGWWLGGCTASSLNGKYIPSSWHDESGFEWYTGNYRVNPAQSRMMLRKAT